MVVAKVSGNTEGPGEEFVAVFVFAFAHGANDFDAGLLENIFGEVAIFHEEERGGIESVFVTVQKNGHSVFVMLFNVLNQRGIGKMG